MCSFFCQNVLSVSGHFKLNFVVPQLSRDKSRCIPQLTSQKTDIRQRYDVRVDRVQTHAMRLGRAWRAIRLCQVAKRARHGILCLQTRSCRIMTIVPGLPSVLWRAVHLTRNFSWDRVTRDIWRFGQYRGYGRRFEELDNTVKKPRPKTVPVPKITLVSPDNSIIVTVLEEAQRLAKRRNFTLVKVSDLENKTQRPLYKLVNSTDILEKTDTIEATQDADETIQIKSNKYTKLLYVSAKIAEHDLRTKMKNLVKLLIKGYKTKVIITLDGVEGDKTQKIIKDAVKNNGNVQQMPSKKNTIFLLITPLQKNEDVSVNNTKKTCNSSI